MSIFTYLQFKTEKKEKVKNKNNKIETNVN